MEEKHSISIGLYIKELVYVAVKNIALIMLIFAITIGAGFVVAMNNEDYHIAYATVSVSARIDDNKVDYNDTVLAQEYVDEICDLSKETVFVDRVRAKYKGDIKESNITAKCTDTKTSLLITFTYRDTTKSDAATKLKTLVEVMIEFLEDGSYFNADVTVVPIRNIENDDIVSKTTQGSDDKKVLLISGVLAIALSALLVFVKSKAKNPIFCEEKLETITGIKALSKINKLNDKQTNFENIIKETEKLANAVIWKTISTGDKVYQMQSSVSGEGKTGVTADLAKCLGASRKKVLVIDCNFHNPSMHTVFDLHIDSGLGEYCEGEKAFDRVVKTTSHENVEVVTLGRRDWSSARVLSSPKFADMIAIAKQKYDFVLIDCSAVQNASDYIQVSKQTDATLFIAQKDKLNGNTVVSTIKELNEYEANVVGAVLTY